MTTELNPWEPPSPIEHERKSIWQRLRELVVPQSEWQRFCSGKPLIYYGVMFWVDGEDGPLHAGLPGSKIDRRTTGRIVAEAIDVLPRFVSEYPQLGPFIKGRDLLVHQIANYSEPRQDVCDPVLVENKEWTKSVRIWFQQSDMQ